jgi:hypothetical protein
MSSSPRGVAGLVGTLTGPDLPFAVEAYDGSRVGPADAPATVRVRSPLAVQRVLSAPGELGFARAYVAGDLDVEGDIYAVLSQRDLLIGPPKRPAQLLALARLARLAGFPTRPPAPPKEEVRLNGWLHSRSRDAAAIAHHYDISNDFYRLILGPTMTYSCGVWEQPTVGLDAAQEAKYEPIARKLELAPGQRLLDVGCGWGGMLIHAARHHHRWAIRRDQFDRHVRARRSGAPRRVLHPAARPAPRGRPAAQPRHQQPHPYYQRHPSSWGMALGVQTRFHRPLHLPGRRVARDRVGGVASPTGGPGGSARGKPA